MSNNKVILGVAAGVAALAVAGIICKRKGYFDNFSEKTGDLKNDLQDKFNNVKESARKKFDEVVNKGDDIAGKLSDADSKQNGKSINPATT